jgi:parvulin-like peptidyl-prolyl isomerase
VAFSLDVDEIGGPVTTPFGLHLIKVTAKEESKPVEFEKVKKEVRAKLIDKEFSTKRKDWMKRLRANAYIEIRNDNEGSMF